MLLYTDNCRQFSVDVANSWSATNRKTTSAVTNTSPTADDSTMEIVLTHARKLTLGYFLLLKTHCSIKIAKIIFLQAGRRIGPWFELPSCKRLLLSVDASNDILSNPANFTPPTRASLFYAARCKAGWQFLTSWKVRIFVGMRSRQMLLFEFSQSSKPNELVSTQCSTIVCARDHAHG